MGGNLRRCSGVNTSQRSCFIQAASGERLAPLGNLNTVDELKVKPSFVCRFQMPKSIIKSASRLPLSPPKGGLTKSASQQVCKSEVIFVTEI